MSLFHAHKRIKPYPKKIYQQNGDIFKDRITQISVYCAEDTEKFDASVISALGELSKLVDRGTYKKDADTEQMQKIDALILSSLDKALMAAKRKCPTELAYDLTQATKYIYIDRDDGVISTTENPNVEKSSQIIDALQAELEPVNERINQVRSRMKRIEAEAARLPEDSRKYMELSQEYEALDMEHESLLNTQGMYSDDLVTAHAGINAFREEDALNRRDRVGVSNTMANTIIKSIEKNADRYADLKERNQGVRDAFSSTHGNAGRESALSAKLALKKQADIDSQMPRTSGGALARKLGSKTE